MDNPTNPTNLTPPNPPNPPNPNPTTPSDPARTTAPTPGPFAAQNPDNTPPELFTPAERRTPRAILWTVLTLLLVLATVLQQISIAPANDPGPIDKGLINPEPDIMETALAKLGLVAQAAAPKNSPFASMGPAATLEMQIDPDDPRYIPVASQRLRAAIQILALDESRDPEPVLRTVADKLDDESPLHDDLDTLRAIADPQSQPTRTQLDALEDRHGWFAQLANALDPQLRDGVLDATMTDIFPYLAIMAVVGGIILLAILVGLIALVILVVFALSGKIRLAMPTPRPIDEFKNGNPWIQTVILFVAGFITLKITITLLVSAGLISAGAASWLTVTAPWLLVATLFFPLLRGMSWTRFKGEIGWHTGKGLASEIGFGALAYAATLPVLIVVVLIYFVVSFIIAQLAGKDFAPPRQAPAELVSQFESPAQLALLVVLATCWAPLVEEAIFRGALYRELRRSMLAPFAIILSAAAFALMHAYGPLQLLLVGTLGVAMAFTRQWRGSLVAPMTQHFVQNSIAMTFLLTLLAMGS